MNFADAVAARRSVRAFTPAPVPDGPVERAVRLAVTAPAPHHSAPWRFVLVRDRGGRAALASAMGEQWRRDLEADGVPHARIETVLERSRTLLTRAPLAVVCCADMSRAHRYADARRERAEWSLFAHSVGAALQTFMVALAEDGIASCWISAPVFCGDVVRAHFGLHDHVEPHALVLAGYPDPGYTPRPRPEPDLARFVVGSW